MILISFILIVVFHKAAFGDIRLQQPEFRSLKLDVSTGISILRLFPPRNENGKISQYSITLRRNDRVGDCIWWIYDCESCRTSKSYPPESIQSHCDYGIDWIKVTIPNSNITDIKIKITNSRKLYILPNKQYRLMAQGYNKAGWGEVLTTTFTPSIYRLQNPEFKSFKSDFSTGISTLRLFPPRNANGKMSQYSITLRRNDGEGRCIWWIYDCESCRSSKSNPPESTQSHCGKMPSSKITISNANMNDIRVTIPNNDSLTVTQNKEYKLMAQGYNGAGWGEILTTLIYSDQ